MGGDSSGSSWGADLDLNSGPVVFERNRAQGGNAPNSYGIEAGPGTIIRNNLLLGGPSSLQSKGAMVWTEAKLSNNTIAGGDANSSVGVQLLNAYTGKMSDVNNNIIFTLGSGTYRYCIYENSAFSDPMSLQGNLLFDCPALYDDENTTELTTIAGVNAMNGQSIMDGTCTSDCQTSRVNTNITTTLTLDELFQSPGGSDGQIETLEDNDWRLLTTDTKITRGGINTGTAACGANEALASCGEVLDDLLGTSARTVPYSIGAYEAP